MTLERSLLAASLCALLAGCRGEWENTLISRQLAQLERAEPLRLGGEGVSLGAGASHSCAVLDGGAVRCWGTPYIGSYAPRRLRYIGDNEHPARAGAVDIDGPAVSLSAKEHNTCALLTNGGVQCWGSAFGPVPLSIVARGTATAIALGDEMLCFLPAHGKPGVVNCARFGAEGQGSTTDSLTIDVGTPVKSLASGYRRFCALTFDGEVKCWDDPLGEQIEPPELVPLDGGASEICGGDYHFCIRSARGVQCWGYGPGVGGSDKFRVTPAFELPDSVSLLRCGGDQTCALMEGDTVRCWGRVPSGVRQDEYQVGPSRSVVYRLGSPVIDIAPSREHTCAALENGDVLCWGYVVALGSPQEYRRAVRAVRRIR
ncbi:RCC1 domain-containing protein [Nannocystis punicea]|uniref:Regulator of chromosome condensation (RCC1) repeat-containing protein n=1 Tax=Nannocystis punicea TaxID=2995304 RepID=A0ABY7GYT1_9BACT|nr:RCC1 domain-containing protein [Nannocystis poenicansa]WAS92050.1 hypothetical protein O0S08_38195 [Nannocystis poenicansa]